MSLVQGDYGNLIHGVSQQPEERLVKGQFKSQVNCRSNLTRGLSARAGFEFIGVLTPDVSSGASLDNAKWTALERGDGNAFILAFGETVPSIFDLTADRKLFGFVGDAQLYYENAITDPKTQFSVDSVIDTTFITNKTVVPLGSNAEDIAVDPERVTWIEFKTFQAGVEIEITYPQLPLGAYEHTVFDGYVTVDPSTGEPDAESERTVEFDGSYHAKAFTELAADPSIVVQYNNWVRITGDDVDIVEIVSGSESIILHENRSVDDISKLPPFAITGDRAVVESARDEDKDLGYFEATRKNGGLGFGEVAWREVAGTGTVGEFDNTTMPHKLVRDNEDDFTLQAIDWTERQVGDSDTNPYPSFIETASPITSVGIFQNRLFLTSSEVVFLGASDSLATPDLWRESAFYSTDADPFEVFADTNELNVIKFAESFDGDLIFFSDNGQFLISGSENQTFKTATVSPVSQFKSNLLADPVLSGDNIFFATDYGNFAGVRELYTDGTDATKRALPVTEHVNEYMQGKIRHMATSTNLNALCALTDSDNKDIFIYEWKRDISNTLQQQAWHRWEMQEGVSVEWVGFIEARLYGVLKVTTVTGEEYQLWSLAWDDPAETHGLHFSICLDGRYELPVGSVIYDEGTMTSTWTTPYDREDLVFVEGTESEDTGFEVDAVRTGVNTWQAYGVDLSGITLIAGLRYDRSVGIPMPQVRDRDGAAKTVDRLQLSKMFLHFSKVGQMEIEVSDVHGRSRTVTYNNRRIGYINNQPSYINTDADTWGFGVRKKTDGLSIELSSNDITPFELRAIEWRGDFKQKGRRT